MKEYFGDYEVSLLVKEKGFNEECLAFYNTDPCFSEPQFTIGKPHLIDEKYVVPAPLLDQLSVFYGEQIDKKYSITQKADIKELFLRKSDYMKKYIKFLFEKELKINQTAK